MNKYIPTNVSPVDLNDIKTSTSGYRYAIVDVTEGDKFTISGTGGTTPLLWAFIDNQNNIISKCFDNYTAKEVVLTAPPNSSKLIINTKTNEPCYLGELLRNKSTLFTDSIGNIWTDSDSRAKWMIDYEENPDCVLSIQQTSVGYYTSELKYSTQGLSNIYHPIPYDQSIYLEMTKPEDAWNLIFGFGYLEEGRFRPVSIVSASSAKYHTNLEVFRARRNLDAEGLYVVVGINTKNLDTKLDDYIKVHRSNPYSKLKFLQLTSIYNIASSQEAFKPDGDQYHIKWYLTPSKTSVRWSDTTYFYAGGQCIDAVFYDKDGNQIPGYPKVGILDPVDEGDYPTSIKIPENAVSYRLAVYGLRVGIHIFLDLSYMLPNTLSRMGVYTYDEIQYTKSHYAGMAVANANKLAQLKYDSNYLLTSKYSLISPKYDNGIMTKRKATGLLYGNFYQLNYGVSWYTYLSFMRIGYGICSYRFYTANAPIGVTCTGFGSNVLGSPIQISVQSMFDKYGDKLECLTEDTVLEPGDVLLETRYRYCSCVYSDQVFEDYENGLLDRNTYVKYGDYIYRILEDGNAITKNDPAKDAKDFDLIRIAYTKTTKTPSQLHLCEYLKDSFRNFNYSSDEIMDNSKHYYTVTSPDRYGLMTHFAIVTALNSDPCSGKLIGHTRVESSNVWTRTWTPTIHDEQWYWKIPARYLKGIKYCDRNYTFEIDKQLDTLNNIDNIEYPPISSTFGDMAIIGNPVVYPSQTESKGYWRNRSYTMFRDERAYRFYTEQGYTKITVIKDGNIIGRDIRIDTLLNYTAAENVGAYNYFDLIKDPLSTQSFYIQDPGEYEIYVGKESETYPYAETRCGKYLLAAVPAVHVSEDFRTIELEGNLDMWDKIYFKVRRTPMVLPGFPYKTPWCNVTVIDGDKVENKSLSTSNTKVYQFNDTDYVWPTELRVTSLKYGQLIFSIRSEFMSTSEFITGVVEPPAEDDDQDPDEF